MSNCFVISPIGKRDSDTREKADRFLEYVAKPAAEAYGYDVIRADQIAKPGEITPDIIRHLKEDPLCIADLTDRNANVYYEVGRRHEVGLPCILLIHESQKAEFNLVGERTIVYRDLTSTSAAWDAVRTLKQFIEQLTEPDPESPVSKEDLDPGRSGTGPEASWPEISETLESIDTNWLEVSESLESIDRRLGTIEKVLRKKPGRTKASRPTHRKPRILENPLRTMHDAVRQGDLNELSQLLPQFEEAMGPTHRATIQTAYVLAINGFDVGAHTLERALTDESSSPDVEGYQAAATGLVQYHVVKDTEKAGYRFLKPVILKAFDVRDDLDDSKRAYLYNQLSILQHGANDHAGALKTLEKVLELRPDDRSYRYNLSIVYEKLGRLQEACDAAVESISDADEPDADHLAHAYEVLSKGGRTEEAEDAWNTLEKIDPARAAWLKRERA
ncbi:MAG: tetratricopeptide repeat protein [Acidobacteriota bacterium]|nr:tetratricopeptide repeat protein [Acidobacteriota bacterium]